jgi:hypothetical protein
MSILSTIKKKVGGLNWVSEIGKEVRYRCRIPLNCLQGETKTQIGGLDFYVLVVRNNAIKIRRHYSCLCIFTAKEDFYCQRH